MFGNRQLRKDLEKECRRAKAFKQAPAVVLEEVYGSLNAREIDGKNRIQRYNDALTAKFAEIDKNLGNDKYLRDLEKQYKGLASGAIVPRTKKITSNK